MLLLPFVAVLALATVAPAEQISRQGLLSMAESAVDQAVILAMVEASCTDFDLTPEIAGELTSAGISADVMQAVIACRSATEELTAPSAPGPEPTVRPTIDRERLHREGWAAVYGTVGFVYHLPLSATREELMQATGDSAKCEYDPRDAANEACEVDVSDYGLMVKGSEYLLAMVRHGRVGGFVHGLRCPTQKCGLSEYGELNTVLTRAYGSAPRKPFKVRGADASGYLSRKFFGAMIPGDTRQKAGWSRGLVETNIYLSHDKQRDQWYVVLFTLDHALNEQ